jgi:predicted transcriptional regulator
MKDSMRDKYDFDGARNNPYTPKPEEHLFEFTAWQIKEIKKAPKEADYGEFVSAEDLANATERYGS